MRNDEHPSGIAFVLGFTLGLVVGAGAALLFAPETGRRTRRKLRATAEELGESAADKLRELGEDAGETMRRSVTRARERLEDLTSR